MEEDTGTPLIGEDRAIREVSDSNSSNCSSAESKLLEQDTSEAPSPRRKGVVPQQNGRWGCQIYANRQRIWLGTFKSKEDASMAYRSSALKLQAAETPRNDANSDEMKFQSLHSVETVLNMIKDGSYQSRFADYLKKCSQLQNVETELQLGLKRAESNKGITSKQMFQKELTPSDVGKLNRLVIPKKFAVQFFPPAPDEENVASKEVQLSFYDKSMKLWKFRYCYWRSSQSYVFTRGWSSFVKEKVLKANDTIAFYSCEGYGGVEGTQNFYVIDVKPRGDISSSSSGSSALTNPTNAILEVPLQLTPREEPLQLTPGPTTVRNAEPEPAPVMLFGVNIRSKGM